MRIRSLQNSYNGQPFNMKILKFYDKHNKKKTKQKQSQEQNNKKNESYLPLVWLYAYPQRQQTI